MVCCAAVIGCGKSNPEPPPPATKPTVPKPVQPKQQAASPAAEATLSSQPGELPKYKLVPPECKQAINGLLQFLNAKNWEERLKHCQIKERIEPKVKAYYSTHPDGPVEVDEIQYLRHDEDTPPAKGLHAVFVLSSRSWAHPLPVMVRATKDFAQVDWLTFIEFKDDLLEKFLANYTDLPGQFHAGIHRTHYFDDSIPEMQKKEWFTISTAMSEIQGHASVTKDTPFAQSIAKIISWDKENSFVVVDLHWRKKGNAKWVELTNIPQLNWYSKDAASPASTGTK